MSTALCISFVLTLAPLTLFCQKLPVKWGDIPNDEMKMSVYPLDSMADAVILCKYESVTYDWNASDKGIMIERHFRIKLLTEQGVDEYGDVLISYYTHKNASELGGLKAQVITPAGKKIKVGKENIFKENNNDYWTTQKIAFPQLQPGSIIEYKYVFRNNDILSPVDFYFQGEIPVKYAEVRSKIPDWFRYVSLNSDLHGVDRISQTKTEAVTTGSGSTNITCNVERYVARNVPALYEEAHITRMQDYCKCSLPILRTSFKL